MNNKVCQLLSWNTVYLSGNSKLELINQTEMLNLTTEEP